MGPKLVKFAQDVSLFKFKLGQRFLQIFVFTLRFLQLQLDLKVLRF